MAVPEFLAGTTLLKGAAYKSEREVRIVASPRHRQDGEVRGEGISRPVRRNRTTPEVRTRRDTGKRYIALFDGLGLRLPVKSRLVRSPRLGVGVSGCPGWSRQI
jgi:hypothetical protein